MKQGDKLFVRIDRKNPDLKSAPKDFEEHVQYLKGVAGERYFLGGGFNNAAGGMLVIAAKDLDEARKIADKDPLVERNFYSYELYEWELLILSEEN